MDPVTKDIFTRLKNNQPVSNAERAYLIRNDVNALAAFMIDNNPGSVNLSLRKLGYDRLKFEPNKKALTKQLQIFLDSGNLEDFKFVVERFNFIPDGLPVEFVNEILKQFPQFN